MQNMLLLCSILWFDLIESFYVVLVSTTLWCIWRVDDDFLSLKLNDQHNDSGHVNDNIRERNDNHNYNNSRSDNHNQNEVNGANIVLLCPSFILVGHIGLH